MSCLRARAWHLFRAGMVLVLLCLVSQRLQGQRAKGKGSGTTRSGASATRTKSQSTIRAELAAVLLQSGRYAEAAREYRLLVEREPANRAYRLNLARALAWGNQPREAERLLAQLHREQPIDGTIASLLRSTRDAFEPRAAEAAAWVGEEPGYRPYRVALARALAREHLLGLAAAQYDTLLRSSDFGSTPSITTLRLELADVYAHSGDWTTGARGLRELLAATPRDTALRHGLAILLSNGNDVRAALAQYDTLLTMTPSASFYVDRARLHLASDDEAAAQRDVTSALTIAPSREAYTLLADMHRRHGAYAEARMALQAALNTPDTAGVPRREILAALGAVAREDRPGQLAPTIGDDAGWLVSLESASDNLGVWYSDLTARRAVTIDGGFVIAGGAEARSFRDRSAISAVDTRAVGANLGISRDMVLGSVLARVGARGGLIQHQGLSALHEWELSGAAWLNAWELALVASEQAAYQTLFTASALVDPEAAPPIMERNLAATLGGPVGPADVAFTAERSHLSDGNIRLTTQAYTRLRLSRTFYAVGAASSLRFADRSTRYWDPLSYVSTGLGVEVAARRTRGWSYAVRVIPGVAFSRELVRVIDTLETSPPDETMRHTAFQVLGGSDVTYRVKAFELGGSVTYGRGRDGDYQRFGGVLSLRWVP